MEFLIFSEKDQKITTHSKINIFTNQGCIKAIVFYRKYKSYSIIISSIHEFIITYKTNYYTKIVKINK